MTVDVIDGEGDRRQGLKQMQPIAGDGEGRLQLCFFFSGGEKTLKCLVKLPPPGRNYIFLKETNSIFLLFFW